MGCTSYSKGGNKHIHGITEDRNTRAPSRFCEVDTNKVCVNQMTEGRPYTHTLFCLGPIRLASTHLQASGRGKRKQKSHERASPPDRKCASEAESTKAEDIHSIMRTNHRGKVKFCAHSQRLQKGSDLHLSRSMASKRSACPPDLPPKNL